MPKELRCSVTGESFTVSDLELELRKKLETPLPNKIPQLRMRRLMAFWQHFALHKRKCDRTGKTIVSVFDEDCPYLVWDREEWIAHADPPSADYDFSKLFFEQLWELFPKCPIPKSIVMRNENCEYTDDWWYSKNCYLSHSGVENENNYYCYRTWVCRDIQYCFFTHRSELCRDLV